MKGLLLGAGFSYEFGMPLTQELTIELKNYLTPNKLKGWILGGSGLSEHAISKLICLLKKEDENYERLVGALLVDSNRHENRNIRSELLHIN